MTKPNETDEWLAELIDSWTDVYKKSMTTYLTLQIIKTKAPTGAIEIMMDLNEATGWQITERAMYRTLRRLEKTVS